MRDIFAWLLAGTLLGTGAALLLLWRQGLDGDRAALRSVRTLIWVLAIAASVFASTVLVSIPQHPAAWLTAAGMTVGIALLFYGARRPVVDDRGHPVTGVDADRLAPWQYTQWQRFNRDEE